MYPIPTEFYKQGYPVLSSLPMFPQRTGAVVFRLYLNTYPEAVNRPPTSYCAKNIPLNTQYSWSGGSPLLGVCSDRV